MTANDFAKINIYQSNSKVLGSFQMYRFILDATFPNWVGPIIGFDFRGPGFSDIMKPFA